MIYSLDSKLDNLIANQSANYGRNEEEIRHSQKKQILPWLTTINISQPTQVYGRVYKKVTKF
jgi:hypothetical protein